MSKLRVLFLMGVLLLVFPLSTLAEKVLVIDPGHGGRFPGTCGLTGAQTGYCEKSAALDIALKLRDALKNTDIKVYMTRSTDVHFAQTNAEDLAERTRVANSFVQGNHDNSLLLSIHHNAVPSNPHVRGLETYYYDGINHYNPTYPPDPMQLTLVNENKRFADFVHSEVLKKTGLIDRKVRNTQSFFVIRNAQMPAVLVELGYMTNRDEERLIRTTTFQQQSADALAKAVIDYFKVFEVFDEKGKKLATFKSRDEALTYAGNQKTFVKVFDKDKQQFIYTSDKFHVFNKLGTKLGEFTNERDAISFAEKQSNVRVVQDRTNFILWSNYIPTKYEAYNGNTLVGSYVDYFQAESVAKQYTNAKVVTIPSNNVVWTNNSNIKVDRVVAVKRISGASRYATALEISKEMYPNGFANDKEHKTVILATGEHFADALSAGPLTSKYGNAPILLTKSTGLNPEVLAEINRLNANHVVIVGGTIAVKEETEKTLINAGLSTTRLSGANRYATNAAILTELGQTNGMFVASGSNYADALAAAPIAAANGWGILLTAPNEITNEALSFVKNKETVIVGGTLAISPSVEQKVKGSATSSKVTRLSGPNRYDTLASLLWHFDGVFTGESILLSTGQNFPDALAAAPLAIHNGAPLVLTSATRNQNVESYLMSYGAKNRINTLKPIGGTEAVSNSTIDVVRNRVK
ncbi:cell wall-binding repeat-containing protein [Bacillus alkalisoli]|uniref:cell wall-binding repeat-containing protein n=1 Tax=Bacillus alkalisoli TaxID=2011008 RepID=UPI0018E1EA9E|nr:cell wall-binding repeat-containing protein [Bacillus alkalisoli]